MGIVIPFGGRFFTLARFPPHPRPSPTRGEGRFCSPSPLVGDKRSAGGGLVGGWGDCPHRIKNLPRKPEPLRRGTLPVHGDLEAGSLFRPASAHAHGHV